MFNFNKKKKIFCIGQNKTGTTTIESVLKTLNYKMGSQKIGEKLRKEWMVRDFKNLVKFCKTADAFQDVPFSNDYTYQILDYEFPNSKFILTIRGSKDEWYNSLINFHTKAIGKGRIPTADDLKEYFYNYKGSLWDGQRIKFGIDESTLYDYKIYTDQYDNHNNRIIEYFKYRQKDLLILNVADSNAMKKLYSFLGFKYNDEKMPHLNKSK